MFTAAFSFMLLGEALSAAGMAGAVVIVASVVAATWVEGRQSAPAASLAPDVYKRQVRWRVGACDSFARFHSRALACVRCRAPAREIPVHLAGNRVIRGKIAGDALGRVQAAGC